MIEFPINSPIEEIQHPDFRQKEVQVFVKRDDLIHPYISGNKWRKLKYILADAELKNQKHLVTFGGAYSNHLLATACAAAKFGFSSTGIVRGEEQDNPTLLLCKLFGMNLVFIDRESYQYKQELFSKYYKQDLNAFYIDEGGAGEPALKGCSELCDELTDTYDHIFCAAGTGTTAAGILRGIEKKKLPIKMHVVPILKGADLLKEDIKNFSGSNSFNFHPDYHFGGYAKTTPELIEFIKSFTSSTGIIIDPVYTGKMFYSIFDLISKNTFPPKSKILAIHTGGSFGILGMAEKFFKIS